MTAILRSDTASAPGFVVVAPSWIGDAIMAQPLLAKLRQQHPDAVIDIIAPRWVAPVFRRMPEVRDIIDSPLMHGKLNWAGILRTAKEIKQQGYAEAIILPNSFKSALVTFVAGIPIRRGFLGEMRYFLLNRITRPDPKKSIRLIDRYLMIADHTTLPQAANDAFLPPHLHSSADEWHQVLANFSIDRQQPIIALCPGAEYGPAKRWPAGHFAQLIDLLSDTDYQVCLLGSQKDDAIAQEIISLLSNETRAPINLCGKTTLNEVIDLLSASTVAVVNDSGLMHVASAVGTHVIAIYGSSSPAYTPPLSPLATIMRCPQPCSPCFQRTCQFSHYHCLRGILPECILQKIRNIA